MKPTQAVITPRVEVERRIVLRFAGYPDGVARTADVGARLDELWAKAGALIHPRAAYRVVGGNEARAAGMPEAADRVGVAVCTIGGELEAAAGRRSAAGKLVDTLLLEAYGSAAAEAVADAANLRLCHIARGLGLRAAPRVSPGYGAWDTACQRELLALLPITRLGITLTDGGMMVPRKSVSFAVSLEEPSATRRLPGSPCRRCGLPHCRHRLSASHGKVLECG